MVDPKMLAEGIRDEVGAVVVGNEDVVDGLVIALLTRGHILLEGVPGVAKTTIAHCFAEAAGLDYNRIQMTPDLLPSDITGSSIYREQTGEFELRRGPVFANIVLADEINRGAPKTQSALLEAMQERQVTLEGESLALPEPFMLVATQNPIETEGVFQLPEAQRDRFQMKLTVEPLRMDEGRELIERFDSNATLDHETIEPVTTRSEVLDAREAVEEIYLDDRVEQYILEIVDATQRSDEIVYGASSRAMLSLLDASKAQAAIDGRDYVIPDDVKRVVEDVLAHRLVLSTDADLGGRTPSNVLADVIDSVDPVSEEFEGPEGSPSGRSEAAADTTEEPT